MKRYAALVFLFTLLLSSCVSQFDSSGSIGGVSRTAADRYQSFALIEMTITTIPTDCTDLSEDSSCNAEIQTAIIAMSPRVMHGSGSGMVVAHRNGRTYVLTANHVCSDDLPDVGITVLMGHVIRLSLENSMSLSTVDISGEHRAARREISDPRHDICIISTEGEWGMPVPIAADQPIMGTIVYNIAAPFGIFEEGMIPTFTGVYSGRDRRGKHFYTIPARPGSSGSPVLDEHGNIVGVIHSIIADFPHISLSASTLEIRALVDQINTLS